MRARGLLEQESQCCAEPSPTYICGIVDFEDLVDGGYKLTQIQFEYITGPELARRGRNVNFIYDGTLQWLILALAWMAPQITASASLYLYVDLYSPSKPCTHF